jgi:hypothetical protein
MFRASTAYHADRVTTALKSAGAASVVRAWRSSVRRRCCRAFERWRLHAWLTELRGLKDLAFSAARDRSEEAREHADLRAADRVIARTALEETAERHRRELASMTAVEQVRTRDAFSRLLLQEATIRTEAEQWADGVVSKVLFESTAGRQAAAATLIRAMAAGNVLRATRALSAKALYRWYRTAKALAAEEIKRHSFELRAAVGEEIKRARALATRHAVSSAHLNEDSKIVQAQLMAQLQGVRCASGARAVRALLRHRRDRLRRCFLMRWRRQATSDDAFDDDGHHSGLVSAATFDESLSSGSDSAISPPRYSNDDEISLPLPPQSPIAVTKSDLSLRAQLDRVLLRTPPSAARVRAVRGRTPGETPRARYREVGQRGWIVE